MAAILGGIAILALEANRQISVRPERRFPGIAVIEYAKQESPYYGIGQENIMGQDALKLRFNELADTWRRETRNISSTTRKLSHHAYRKIVDEIGPSAIPWVIDRLHDGPRHWFFALMEISGENPVDASLEGNLPAMIRAWEQWGRAHGKIA